MTQGQGGLITFEGGEGAGKSTQIRRLADHMTALGLDVVTTREPGGAPGAEAIRKLLVEGDPGRWDALTEALLNSAARREHLRTTIIPALARGAWVLCDRFADSTMAYQGYGHGLPKAQVSALYDMVRDGLAPTLTLIFDLPVEVGLARAGRRGGAEDRFERMERDFHERLRAGFLEIARAEPDRCAVIDAAADLDAVTEQVLQVVAARLGLAP